MSFGIISGIVTVIIFIGVFSFLVSVFGRSHKVIKDGMDEVFKNIREGLELDGNLTFGTTQEDTTPTRTTCEYCGASIEAGEHNCPNCGARLTKK